MKKLSTEFTGFSLDIKEPDLLLLLFTEFELNILLQFCCPLLLLLFLLNKL